jgi:(p)ppGpp synthase/HD superfamily hydrolase
MPLHAITEVYGEVGLRQRWALEVADLPGPDRAMVDDALALAGELHRDDRRQREPYVNHLLRVAIRIITYYRVRDADILAAALLHDAVEDHPDELGGSTEAALDTLARRYNARVAALVSSVTNPDYDPDRDAHEQYREHVAQALAEDPWARVIKVSDFTDNGVGLIHTSGPKMLNLAVKYAPLLPVLRALVARPDTPLPEDVRQLIYHQFDTAAERFRAILGG